MTPDEPPGGDDAPEDPVVATRERVEEALRRREEAATARPHGLFDARPARPSPPDHWRTAVRDRVAGGPLPPPPEPEEPQTTVRERVAHRLDEAEDRRAAREAAPEPKPPELQVSLPVRPEPEPEAPEEPERRPFPSAPPRPGFGSRVAALIATCGFLGRIPPAPGTLGALAGLGAFWLARALPDPAPGFLFLAALLVGTWAAGRHARDLGQKDPSAVVVDEFCGMWLALLAVANPSLLVAGVAFVAFRVLDIAKPPPIRQLERLPGGIGIMADDLLAGALVRAGLFVALGF